MAKSTRQMTAGPQAVGQPKAKTITVEAAVSILLEEYKTLRDESLQSIQARHQVITFAFGAISVIIAGMMTSNASYILLSVLGIFAVPQLAKASLMMWLGEYGRCARAGTRLRLLEVRINDYMGCELLNWENGLSKARSHMNFPYTATVVAVLGASYTSSIIGIFFATSYVSRQSTINFPAGFGSYNINPSVFGMITLIFTVLIFAASEVIFWRYFISLWQNARQSHYLSGTS